MMNRRSFFAAIACLSFVGRLSAPKRVESLNEVLKRHYSDLHGQKVRWEEWTPRETAKFWKQLGIKEIRR